MELLAEALRWPLSSIEGIAFLELLVIIAIGLIYMNVRKLRKEASDGRNRIYKKIEQEVKKLQEEISKVWAAVRDHERECADRNEKDAEWKGSVDAQLKNLSKKD